MWLTWRQRLAQQPEYGDFVAWPRIDAAGLPSSRRARFLRNQAIIAAALAHQSFKTIAAKHHVDISFVSVLMQRALGGDDTADPALTEALIPHRHIRKGRRHKPLSTLAQRTGARGAFTELLRQLPALKKQLDETIHAAAIKAPYSQNLKPQLVHAEFKRFLAEAHWPADTYPYTEVDVGYESVRRYLEERMLKESLRPPKERRPPTHRSLAGRGMYAHVEIDEHTTDVATTIHLEYDGKLFPMRLPRVALLLAVDVASDAYLGHYISLTKQCTQDDLLALLHQIHTRWSPMELHTPGLAYQPGACLPSALGEPYSNAAVGMFHLDNALMHTALSVRHWMCEVEGATQQYGLPGQPTDRHHIEHAFDLCARHEHRFASTTGSFPTDPAKESRANAQHPPVVTLRAFEEALSTLVANHNVIPQARFGHRSPLDVLQAQAQDWTRTLPDSVLSRCNPFIHQVDVPVHLSKDHRQPHINFAYLRYQGAALSHSDLVHRPVRIVFDRRDLRVLQAYRLNGVYLGEVYAPESWQRFAHGMTTRKRIMHLQHADQRLRKDPLQGYFAYLLEHRSLPASSLEIIRIYREGDLGRLWVTPSGESSLAAALIAPTGSPHARWSPTLARQRRPS